jgi:outer membrane protein insertion porin family
MAKFIAFFLIAVFCQNCFFTSIAVSASSFKLSSISVLGNNRISDEAIVNYARLIPSATLSSEDLSKAYSKVLDTGLFKNISFKQDGQNLIITVEEYPTVNEISFEGNKKFTDEKLMSFLVNDSNLVFTPVGLEKDLTALQTIYRNSGRLSARVQSKIINLPNNRINLIFEIFEGSVVEIEKINFVGNREFSNSRLRRVLSSKQAGLLRKIILRDTLIEEKIALDKRLLIDFYRSRGFAEFKINSVNVELSEEKDGFFMTFNVTEGPKFAVGEIKLRSTVKDISVSDFETLIKLKTGETYSPVVLQSTITSLEDRLQAIGLEFIRVRPEINRNINNLTLDFDLIFEKGDRIFIERIDISGNTATLDRVLRRQFFIAEGDPFNPREIKAAADRIRGLGLFSDTSVDARSGSINSQVVIDVKVVEKPTGSLTFGAGYSSQAGLGALIEYGERNFLGRGQSLSFAINTGKNDQVYEVSFFEPMFLRNDLGFGLNLSVKDTNQQNAAYDTENLQFQPFVVYPLGERSKIKIDYSVSQTELSNPGDVGSIITNEVNEGKVVSSSVGYVFSHDTRLYESASKTGIVFKLGQQFTGLGGDKTALKTTMTVAAQRNVFKEDLKLSAEFESGLLTYKKGDSRVIDRFFLGSRKMRGFDAGGLGPRECSNRDCEVSQNDALGGENFAVLRLEAEFPLGLPDEYGLSGGLFYDIGNLWSLKKVSDNVLYEEGSWRQAIGASVFWKTPIGPLRFNFSDVLKKEQFDRDESFDLTISTRF